MVQVTGFNDNLSSGELAPEAWERSDLQQHANGCEQAFNFLGAIAGPILSRGGFMRVGAPRYQDRARRRFSWNRADGEGLVLELGHLYGRVWTARGVRLEASPGVPVQFDHPFRDIDLPRLRLAQVGDIGFLTSGDGLKFQRIERLSDTSWSVGDYELKDGPYLPENTDPAKTIYMVDGGTGTFNALASFDLFQPEHVGALFRIRGHGGGVGVPSWAPNTLMVAGQYVLSAGRVYSNGSGGIKSGNTPPNHTSGAVSDGAITWTFRQDGQCYAKVLGVTDARNAIMVVPFEGPFNPLGDFITNWSEHAFSGVQGWPTALAAVREERLVLAGAKNNPDVVQLSRTAGFTPDVGDFKPGLGTGQVNDDDAASCRVGGKRARILWAVDALNLVVGTTEAEWIVSGGSIDEPIAPASIAPRRISGHGSAEVMPVVIQGPPVLLLHVARGGTILRELQLAASSVEPQGRDLSVLAQHIFGLKVRAMAWSQPDQTLWLLLGDGTLAAYTYHFEEQVLGVRRQPMPGGWLAEDIATAPDPDGADRLHVAAVRQKNGATQRAEFILTQRAEGVFVDCAQRYTGAPATEFIGLDHLNGETVTILADGGLLEPQVVEAGKIDLAEAAADVIVGLPLLRRFKSLPFDPTKDGASAAKRSRPINAHVVLGCVRAKVYAEAQDEPGEAAPLFEQVDARRPGDAVPVLRRKRQKVALAGGADRDNRLVVECADPFDLVIYASRTSQDEQ